MKTAPLPIKASAGRPPQTSGIRQLPVIIAAAGERSSKRFIEFSNANIRNTMFQIDGQNTGAAFQLNAAMLAAGVPPNWSVYIAVDSADDAAAQVKSLGGEVLRAPFDVLNAGRMAVLADPTGAVFNIWQAGEQPSALLSSEEGAFCWADLSTPDPQKAGGFYEQLFGWTIAAAPHDPSGYLHIQNGDQFIGGIPPASQRNPHTPPHWLLYFQTADCDGSTTKAEERGARVLLPPMSMPNVGRMSIVSDPQGAVFALFEPQNAA